MRRLVLLLAVLATAAPAAAATAPPTRDVVLVANAEGGTVSIVDARALTVLRELDVVPDGRSAALGADDPLQALAGQRVIELAGGTNLAQDQDVAPDGRTLYVSRGHRGDVAAFDLVTGALRWKVPVPGLRADHMTISPDGRRLFVSALTDDHVHVVDTRTARLTGAFATGQWPHDNHLSHDGERLYNASIGTIVAPEEARAALPTPPYVLTVADPVTLRVLRTHRFERGIRPYVLSDDETRMFAQLSLLHGLVEIALPQGREVRRLDLPVDPGVTEDDFDFEAPHHGLALSGDGRTLCAAGRASDYVAFVDTGSLRPAAVVEVGDAPGWAATGPDGTRCFVPNTREDTLSVLSYAERREVDRLPVGDGPKQVEAARLPESVLCARAGTPGCRPQVRLARRCAGRGRVRVSVTGEAIRAVTFRAGTRRLRDRRPPFRRVLRVRGPRLTATVELDSGPQRRLVLRRSLPRC